MEHLTNRYGDVAQNVDNVLSYLGMHVEIDSEKETVTVSQPGYIAKLLDKYNPMGRKRDVPWPNTMAMRKGDDIPYDKDEYLQLIGSLSYLAQYSRPELLYAVSKAAQSCSHPNRYCWRKAMNIIYYLQATKHVGLVFRGGDINLEGWVDAGFNQDETASCQYGYGFRLSPDDAFFFSVSRKIGLAVTSSTQAEYVAMYEAAREASWLRRFLAELGFTQQGPTSMFEDNEPCITQVTGQVINFQATKHYLPKYMYTRELYAEGSIDLVYVETCNQIADIFTKPLSTTLFQKFTAELLCIHVRDLDLHYYSDGHQSDDSDSISENMDEDEEL
jgi:hypothetical protein